MQALIWRYAKLLQATITQIRPRRMKNKTQSVNQYGGRRGIRSINQSCRKYRLLSLTSKSPSERAGARGRAPPLTGSPNGHWSNRKCGVAPLPLPTRASRPGSAVAGRSPPPPVRSLIQSALINLQIKNIAA